MLNSNKMINNLSLNNLTIIVLYEKCFWTDMICQPIILNIFYTIFKFMTMWHNILRTIIVHNIKYNYRY